MLPFHLGTGLIGLLKELIVVRFPYIARRILFSQGPSVWGLRPGIALFIAACSTLFTMHDWIEGIVNPSIQGREVAKVQDLELPEVAEITFRGNEHFHSIFLRTVIETDRSGLYHPPTLQADLLRLRKFYFDRGFLEATARVEHVEKDPTNNVVQVAIAIDEGPPTIVHAVQLAGTLPPELPAKPDILKRLPLQAGQRLSKAAFDASSLQLRELLYNAGYARARIEPNTEVDIATHDAIITLTFHPGRAVPFGRILITGGSRVDENTIRRHLSIKEGERYFPQRITEGIERLKRLGKFRCITPKVLNPDEDDAPLDVEINVVELIPPHGFIKITLVLPSLRRPRTLESIKCDQNSWTAG